MEYTETETATAPQVTDTDITETNYSIYRDALAAVLIDKLAEPEAKPKKKRQRKTRAGRESIEKPEIKDEPENTAEIETNNTSPDDVAEFVDYIAQETFDFLPDELKTLAHHIWVADAKLRDRFGGEDDGSSANNKDDKKEKDSDKIAPAAPLTSPQVTRLMPSLDPSPVADSMQAYGLTGAATAKSTRGGRSAADIIAPALSAYLASVTTAPPAPRSTRDDVDGCEICGRDNINLSYHHLIPRFVHNKVIKRGWHRPDELQNVAWLCGACHRRVHQFANHEDLARHYYTVERLMAEPEMQRYAAWASRLRWKKK